MKKLCLVSLLCLVLYACGGSSSPTAAPTPPPLPPKPQGIYIVTWHSVEGGFDKRICMFYVVSRYTIANTNNVTATVSKEVFQYMFKGQVAYTQTFNDTYTVSANGSKTFVVSTGVNSAEHTNCQRPAKIRLQVTLLDSNGYSQVFISDARAIYYSYLPSSVLNAPMFKHAE